MDNLAPVIDAVEPVEDDNKVLVNAAFYRKLTQQIVQKDNIIKLLRLQVEEMNRASANGSLSPDDEHTVSTLKADIARLEDELTAQQQRFRQLMREQGFSQEERFELLEQVENYKRKLSTLESDNSKLIKEVGELKTERTDLTSRLVNLSDEFASLKASPGLSEEDEQLLRSELKSLRSEMAELESENKRLHKRLVEARDTIAASDEVVDNLTQRLQRAERKLESLPDFEKLEAENEELKRASLEISNENADLRLRLEDALKRAQQLVASSAKRFSQSDWRILSGVIQMYEAILELSGNIPDADLEEMVFSVFDALKLDKIESVGTFFDSRVHTAVETILSTEYNHGLIIGEKSPGYEASGVVVKPAEVIVSAHPYWCEKCERAASEGSLFCNSCGEPLERKQTAVNSNRPGKCDELIALGRVLEKSMEFSKALERYREALDIDSCNKEALRGLARIEELSGNWDAALDAYKLLEEQGALGASESRGRRRVKLKSEISKLVKDIF